MVTIRCEFSVDDRGEDVLASVTFDGRRFDVIRPLDLTADSEDDLFTIVYEVCESVGVGTGRAGGGHPVVSDGVRPDFLAASDARRNVG